MVPQQNKGCKHFPDHSRSNSDQIISKNTYFYSKFIENRGFSIKIAKKIKIVAKALLRYGSLLKAIPPGCSPSPRMLPELSICNIPRIGLSKKIRFPTFPGLWRMLQTSISNISRIAINNSYPWSI